MIDSLKMTKKCVFLDVWLENRGKNVAKRLRQDAWWKTSVSHVSLCVSLCISLSAFHTFYSKKAILYLDFRSFLILFSEVDTNYIPHNQFSVRLQEKRLPNALKPARARSLFILKPTNPRTTHGDTLLSSKSYINRERCGPHETHEKNTKRNPHTQEKTVPAVVLLYIKEKNCSILPWMERKFDQPRRDPRITTISADGLYHVDLEWIQFR